MAAAALRSSRRARTTCPSAGTSSSRARRRSRTPASSATSSGSALTERACQRTIGKKNSIRRRQSCINTRYKRLKEGSLSSEIRLLLLRQPLWASFIDEIAAIFSFPKTSSFVSPLLFPDNYSYSLPHGFSEEKAISSFCLRSSKQDIFSTKFVIKSGMRIIMAHLKRNANLLSPLLQPQLRNIFFIYSLVCFCLLLSNITAQAPIEYIWQKRKKVNLPFFSIIAPLLVINHYYYYLYTLVLHILASILKTQKRALEDSPLFWFPLWSPLIS